jgi:hypothetical protein
MCYMGSDRLLFIGERRAAQPMSMREVAVYTA